MAREPLPDNDLRSRDMVGREKGVGGAAGKLHGMTNHIDDLPVADIAAADSAQISDIMAERGDDKMKPVLRRDRSLQPPPAHDVLGNKRYLGGMNSVVIQRIAHGNPFNDQTSGFIEKSRDMRLAAAKCAKKDRREPLPELL